MGQWNDFDLFSARERIRRLKSLSWVFHLFTVAGLVISTLWLIPNFTQRSLFEVNSELQNRYIARQLLLETLDKLARYQQFFHELNGRYTQDLSRLSLPKRLASGNRTELDAHYEISVIEAHPNRFLLLAAGICNSDRITGDERLRLNANFILPPLSRAYLFEEADRILRLKAQGETPDEGLLDRYWQVSAEGGQAWVAIGKRDPVLGERRELGAERAISSIFTDVSETVKSKLVPNW